MSLLIALILPSFESTHLYILPNLKNAYNDRNNQRGNRAENLDRL